MSLAGRKLRPELLDELPASAPEAVHSRGDLRRLNALMGNAGLLNGMARELKLSPPKTLVELATGDGTLLIQLLERTGWRPERVVLLDRQPVVSVETLARLRERAKQVEVVTADVFEWLGAIQTPRCDLITTNLFLHHFEDEQLRRMLSLIAAKTEAFIACEPRRSKFALLNSQLLGLIGCNHVTRHDAPVSVKAGFVGEELSQLWLKGFTWVKKEQAKGLFSHCFGARKISSEV
ncbi:MAG TPA: methyltransferase domain-containing protein [Verrucomicrobiae bacterium]